MSRLIPQALGLFIQAYPDLFLFLYRNGIYLVDFLSNPYLYTSLMLHPHIGSFPKRVYDWLAYDPRKAPARRSRRRRHRRRRGFTNRVKAIVDGQAESKFLDTSVSGTIPVAGTSLMQCLTLIATGDSNITREGDKVKLLSVQVRGQVTGDASGASATTARMMLIHAKRDVDGALPAVTDILMSDSVHALKQIDNRGYFKVLWDSRFSIKETGDSAQLPTVLVDYYKKFPKPIDAYFIASTAAITSNSSGHLFLLMMTDQATNDEPTWGLECRVVFKET